MTTPSCVVQPTPWKKGVVIQRQAEEVACVNLMRSKCKGLHMDWENLKHKQRLENEWIASSPEKKGVWAVGGEAHYMTQ